MSEVVGVKGEVLQGGGDEDGFAAGDGDGFHVGGGDGESSLEAHVDDKRVEGDVVTVGGTGEGKEAGGEIGALNKLHRLVVFGGVADLVGGVVAVVNDIGGQFGMQLAGVAVGVVAVVVVDAVGDIGGLLDLGDKTPFADGMYQSGRNKKAVTFPAGFDVQQFR